MHLSDGKVVTALASNSPEVSGRVEKGAGPLGKWIQSWADTTYIVRERKKNYSKGTWLTSASAYCAYFARSAVPNPRTADSAIITFVALNDGREFNVHTKLRVLEDVK